MKTTNNVQKTENKKFGNPLSKTFAVILSLVLISLTVSANGFWKNLLVNNTYGKMATLMVEQEKWNEEPMVQASTDLLSGSGEVVITSTAISSKPATAKIQETGNKVNGKIEAEPAPQLETRMNNHAYNAEEFAKADMSKEIEEWKTTNP